MANPDKKVGGAYVRINSIFRKETPFGINRCCDTNDDEFWYIHTNFYRNSNRNY
ncbi:hypothetical protein MXF31_02865 [Mammaliicoccus sciuri]|nr:hypothetical protein [Mammaliicoccus sciuri]MEB5648580.1 hypothetical protein [Mammaliicoccus sciuri]